MIRENGRSHLKLRIAAVAAFLSHAVIAKDNECCIVVHLVNDFSDKLLSFEQLALDLGVLATKGMAGAIEADHMDKHEVKIAAFI